LCQRRAAVLDARFCFHDAPSRIGQSAAAIASPEVNRLPLLRCAAILDLCCFPGLSMLHHGPAGCRGTQRVRSPRVLYVSNLKNGRIDNADFAELEAIAGALGFSPTLWFGEGKRIADEALLAALEVEPVRAILKASLMLARRDKVLLLGIARQISGYYGVC
jgi:hypothetical protein